MSDGDGRALPSYDDLLQEVQELRAENGRLRDLLGVSASALVPWKVTERWMVRPVTGSVPAATRISHTPGRRSRLVPVPRAAVMGPQCRDRSRDALGVPTSETGLRRLVTCEPVKWSV